MRVSTHAGSGWSPGGVGWGAYDYAVTNRFPDGALPARVAPWWQTYNLVRGRPVADRVPLAELTIESQERCAEGALSVRVANQGMAPVPAGVAVVLHSDGEVLARATLPALVSGEGVSRVLLSAEQSWTTAEVLVDPDGQIPEFDASNNRLEVAFA